MFFFSKVDEPLEQDLGDEAENESEDDFKGMLVLQFRNFRNLPFYCHC